MDCPCQLRGADLRQQRWSKGREDFQKLGRIREVGEAAERWYSTNPKANSEHQKRHRLHSVLWQNYC